MLNINRFSTWQVISTEHWNERSGGALLSPDQFSDGQLTFQENKHEVGGNYGSNCIRRYGRGRNSRCCGYRWPLVGVPYQVDVECNNALSVRMAYDYMGQSVVFDVPEFLFD